MSASNTGSLFCRAASLGGGSRLIWFDRSRCVLARVGTPDSDRTEGLIALPQLISLLQNSRRVALARRVDGNEGIWLLDLERSGVTRRLRLLDSME